MKKTIFLFFAAILCSMTANAQWALMGTLTDWSSGKAMTVSGSTATCTVDLPGKTTYTLKVKNGSTWYGRNSTTISATTTTSAFSTSGGDVTLNTDIPGTYTFSFNTSTKKLTVTYPTAPAPHDITVRAQAPASWTNTITAWVWTSENGTGEEVIPTKDGDYYVVTKNAGALYVIFKNGAGWNGDKNQTVDLCYTEDVCLQLNQSGTAKATATVIDCGAIAKDITVKAVVPGAWENTITAWVWPTGGEGKEVTPTKDGNWYVVTENCIELNVIFKNGTGWNGNENQTANIEGVSENTCYQISAINKDGEGKCTYTVVDCEAAIEPEEKPAPTPTFDYYVVGTINSWGLKDANFGMTDENADGVYEKEVTLAAGVNELKVNNGTWDNASTFGFGNLAEMYEETSDNGGNIKVTLAAEKAITVIFDSNTKKITLDGLTVKTNVVTYDYYVIGTVNGWASKDENYGMTDENADGVYEKEVTLAAGDHEIKVNNGTWDDGCHWGFGDLAETYEETADASGNIKVTLAAEKAIIVIFDSNTKKITLEGLTVAAPAPTYDYYVIGSINSWATKDANYGMTDENADGVYEKEVTLAAGDHEIKVNNGTWDDGFHWGFGDLAETYEETADASGNIKVTLAAEKAITVIFDSNTKKITLEGLTVAAPVEKHYYIAGTQNLTGFDWQVDGLEMTEDAGVYKHTFSALPAGTFEFKVTQGDWNKESWGYYQLGAAYEEVSEGTDGGGNPNGNIKFVTEEAKNITVIFDPATGKITIDGLTEKAPVVSTYALMGVNGDWTTGITMTVNPDNADEYVLKAQSISSTDAIKVLETAGSTQTWHNTVDAYSNATYTLVDDGFGGKNIVLPAGTYNFYFKKINNEIYIEEVYVRDVTNTYGTICLPYASNSYDGAIFYRVAGKETGKVYLESVSALEAGVPYIFEKTASKIVVARNGDPVATAGNANGLVGTFTNETEVAAGNYILYNNQLRPSDGSAKVNANRAYLDMNAVTGGAPQQLPGRRYIGMSVQGENEATGFENITAPADKAVKAIVNGQLIIIRDGEMYNAQGVRL